MADGPHECLNCNRLERELAELENSIRCLRSEVDCRIDHGAESGGHLEYVLGQLNMMLAEKVIEKQDQKFNLRPIHDWHPAYKLPDAAARKEEPYTPERDGDGP